MNEPTPELLAHMELKGQIVELMFEFLEKYCGANNPKNLYPKTGYILVNVLEDCLWEAKQQVKG